MKLLELKCQHFLSLASFTLEFAKPVTLICGHNEAGKTSVANAISFALTGLPRRADITKKKDLAYLVTHGQKLGKVRATVSHEGNNLAYERAITTGFCSQADIDDPWFECCLDMHRFSNLDAERRRRLLFSDRPTFKSVAELAKRRFHLNHDLLFRYRNWIETGFDQAMEKIRADIRELKGEWKGVTAETWGAEKGGVWEAQTPNKPQAIKGGEKAVIGDISILRKELAAIQSEKGVIKKKIAEIEGQSALLAQMEKDANLDKDFTKIMADLEQEHVRAEEKAFSGREVMEGVQSCPHCGGALAISRHRVIPVQLKGTESAQAALKAIEERIEEVEQEAKAAKLARDQIEKTRRELESTDSYQARITEIQRQVARYQEMIAENQQWMDASEHYAMHLKHGKDLEKRALKIHQEILGLNTIAQALSGDGIPAVLGAEKLERINAMLHESAKQTGWREVHISEDGEIGADGEPYFLLSESAQWRADAQLTLVLGQVSGWKMAVLDRMDVLDIKGRSKALRWLSEAHKVMDTIIVMATLKEKPSMDANFLQVEWLY